MVAGLSISYLTNRLTEREPPERLSNLADQLWRNWYDAEASAVERKFSSPGNKGKSEIRGGIKGRCPNSFGLEFGHRPLERSNLWI